MVDQKLLLLLIYFSSSDDFFSPLFSPFRPSFFISLSLFSFPFFSFSLNFMLFSLSSLIFLRLILSCSSHLLSFLSFSLVPFFSFSPFSPGFSLFHTHSIFTLPCFCFSHLFLSFLIYFSLFHLFSLISFIFPLICFILFYFSFLFSSLFLFQ